MTGATTTRATSMDPTILDKKIEFAERKVLIFQKRVIEKKEEANLTVKRLEREAKGLAEIKKEWLKKKDLEEERVRVETQELRRAHRHALEDLRVKYEKERENKLRDLKTLIQEEEKEVQEWQRKRDEAAMLTAAEEAKIKSSYQVKLNALLREEQSASRRGVVRQKRLLDTPNVFSMTLETNQPIGMKKRPTYRRLA